VVSLIVGREAALRGAAGKLDVTHDIPMPVNALFRLPHDQAGTSSIMMLFEQGKLKLDDPVSKYLTGFDNLQVITKFNEKDRLRNATAKRPMTIRHLLTHTSASPTGI